MFMMHSMNVNDLKSLSVQFNMPGLNSPQMKLNNDEINQNAIEEEGFSDLEEDVDNLLDVNND